MPGPAARLELSASETHAAVKRAGLAGLLLGRAVDRSALLECLRHGVRYAFCASRGAPTRGVPAGVLAPPLNTLLSATEGGRPPTARRAAALAPLYRTAPAAARRDASVKEVLALTDTLREGGARRWRPDITDPALLAPRVTLDVDVVVDVANRRQF